MRKYIVGIALIAAAVSTAEATEVTDSQITAALAEWLYANCGTEKMPAMTAAVIPMIINGSEPGAMEEARRQVRARIAARFPDRDEACVELYKPFQQK